MGKAEIILHWFECNSIELFMTCTHELVIKKQENGRERLNNVHRMLDSLLLTFMRNN